MFYPKLKQELFDNLKKLGVPIDEVDKNNCWIPIRRSLATENPVYPKLLWIGNITRDKMIDTMTCDCHHSGSYEPYMEAEEIYFCPIDKAVAYIARTYFEEIDTENT